MLLHVAPGRSSAGALRQALGQVAEQSVLELHDSLSFGPLPLVSSLERWAAWRERFWREILDPLGLHPEGSVLPDLGSVAGAEQIVMWVGHGLDDQLQFLWLCWALRELAVDRGRLSVVELRMPSRNNAPCPSAGMLIAEHLRRQPAPVQVPPERVSLLDRAWAAVTSPRPSALVELLGTLPIESTLARALKQLARRYPQRASGVSAWDHALLGNTLRVGPGAARIVGHTLVAPGSELDKIGDAWLFWRLQHFATRRCPLLALDGEPSNGRFQVTLTDTGRRVLEGRDNAVTLSGIDEWVAGVHLDSSANRVWFAEGDRICC